MGKYSKIIIKSENGYKRFNKETILVASRPATISFCTRDLLYRNKKYYVVHHETSGLPRLATDPIRERFIAECYNTRVEALKAIKDAGYTDMWLRLADGKFTTKIEYKNVLKLFKARSSKKH